MSYERSLILIVLGIIVGVSGFLFLLLAALLVGQEARTASLYKIGGVVTCIGAGMIVYGIVGLRRIKAQKSKR